MPQKMTQSQIDSLLKDSDLQDSVSKSSQIQPHAKFQAQTQNHNEQESNEYGQSSFEDFYQSKRTQRLNNKKTNKKSNVQVSSAYDSYGGEQFESYQQSRRTQQFERSHPKIKSTNKLKSQQLMPIQQQTSNKTGAKKNEVGKKSKFTQSPEKSTFNKNKVSITIAQPVKSQPKLKQTYIKMQQTNKQTNRQVKQNKNTPYNYNRLQQRQRQLLFTSLVQENKKLKQLLSQKDKQISTTKSKYNILLQEKAQTLGNVKEATLIKRLQQLQGKYDGLLKEKAKQRAYKTVSATMSKTMNNGFVLQTQAHERQQQLLNIIQKLKQRLIATDKQLKTLQQKMNQGLDYQEQLQRKFKRVEQLQLRLQKMKDQGQDDRFLIQTLKEKSKQQKTKIQELQQQKNQLYLSLKRAQMTHLTHSDLATELQQTRKQKQLLQKSLRQLSSNFKNVNGAKKAPKNQFQDIQDSNQFINYKK